MNGWTWALAGFVVLVVGALYAGAPDINRYLKMRRM
jgi:hypothetical protein